MSFTVMHKKGDKIVPIRMSIWDALKGVPDPKPRRPIQAKCDCCGKFHGSTLHIKTDSVKRDEKSASNIGYTGDTVFTADDDAIITRMKEANPGLPWIDVSKAIGKSNPDELKDYWKKSLHERSDKTKETTGAKIQETKEKPGKGKNADKSGNANQGGKATQENNQKANKKDANATDKLNGMRAWAAGYDRRKWLAAASKHYDLTGQRITPEMARKMAEGK